MAEIDESDVSVHRDRMSKEAIFYYCNTLTGLVKALEGQYTTIDLRNESCVTGKICFVDGKMNVEMKDAVFHDAMGSKHAFPSFFISKRHIRYVHIPKNTSAAELMDKQLGSLQYKPVKKQHTFKKVRAKRYNAEITQSAFSGEALSTTN